ncbi:acylneuraminate cytidylyltransferase [Paenibacillus spongiae]|uniref:N-acylneuraminate cytidylyltransferase n=1 Tax=Paenibacillus spongiae TaxID=2909671 RepID=A0ABY5S850_9BACL|nr:acylneuraminate cytidylyltransferase [Paenibacillus spongiae]UVI29884.1 acylneuraminate cytidylyltransferase [Paenibacillus spongiae]
MEKSLKTVAFIPARGGSKSIPLKNIKQIAGKPLIQWTIDAAIECSLIDHVYVSTDCDIIRNIVQECANEKVTVIGRSEETATDHASSEMALLEFTRKYRFENVVFIQATSPLLEAADLEKAIQYYDDEPFDSLLSVVRQKRFMWTVNSDGTVSPGNYDYRRRPRRQEFDGYLVENGAFYITGRERLLQSENRISGAIGHYEMDAASYLEIDEPEDWIIIEQLLRRKKNREIQRICQNIKLFITDCDGVLTDGGMYYSENGDELKRFNTKDAVGLGLLREQGILTAIITGEDVDLVRRRARKMKVEEVHLGITNKMEVINKLAAKYSISLDQVAYIGDDLNDYDVIGNVGLSFSVNDATECIKERADIVTLSNGGQGAVREACEFIIRYIR